MRWVSGWVGGKSVSHAKGAMFLGCFRMGHLRFRHAEVGHIYNVFTPLKGGHE